MASPGQMKMAFVVVCMMAIVAAGGALESPETCVEDVPGANACICSKNCACAGKCIIQGGDGDRVKICFVECVLKNDCNCLGKHAAEAPSRKL